MGRESIVSDQTWGRAAAGVIAGSVAGLVMAVAVAGYHMARGESVWAEPNMSAALWMGAGVADDKLTPATAAGFLTHMATSALMGLVAVPFIRDLRPRRTVLVAFTYALASYPLVFSTVIRFFDPVMFARTDMTVKTAAHALFGFVLGVVYLWLRHSRIIASA